MDCMVPGGLLSPGAWFSRDSLMLLGLHKARNSQGITFLSLPGLKSKAHSTWGIQLLAGCSRETLIARGKARQ